MGRPPNEPDPSAGPLELFAYEHRRYRKAAGISQSELATEIVFTPQFVGMVEVAARTPGWQYVEGADRVLGANGGLIACWRLVSRMHIPKWFGPFIDVEAKARADPPMQWMIIDENAFRRPVGGPGVLRAQYAHLLKIADLPHVDIQILPYDAGAHPGQNGAFTILELESGEEIVWVEPTGEGHFVDRPELVAEYVRRYDHLRVAALSPTASHKWITQLLEATCEPPTPADSAGASPATALTKAASASR